MPTMQNSSKGATDARGDGGGGGTAVGCCCKHTPQLSGYKQGGGPAGELQVSEIEPPQHAVGPPGRRSQPGPPHRPQDRAQHAKPWASDTPSVHLSWAQELG
mmetsp:Transcript_95669/g.308684  ORF Transcript_95669/g.308684 Transcript_95669/m.308684 type:complete len:102 (-) Transcript_95669:360-665(-)